MPLSPPVSLSRQSVLRADLPWAASRCIQSGAWDGLRLGQNPYPVRAPVCVNGRYICTYCIRWLGSLLICESADRVPYLLAKFLPLTQRKYVTPNKLRCFREPYCRQGFLHIKHSSIYWNVYTACVPDADVKSGLPTNICHINDQAPSNGLKPLNVFLVFWKV